MNVETYERVPPREILDGCVTVYAAAFGQPPYGESHGQAEELRDRVSSYAQRDGFRFPVAFAADGTPCGFALGVTAHPGDWWRDKVAAALDIETGQRWLGGACREVVHVAVDPGEQRHGTGHLLMASLLAPPRPGTGVLSCHPRAAVAQHFYLSQGWQLITTDFRTQPDQLPFWLMGLDLA